GGGVYSGSALLLTQCSIFGNTAGQPGGGLATPGESVATALSASYFCSNFPDNASGVYFDLGGNFFGDDCNMNGICDNDELADGAEDKNANGTLDECELARGDLNLDGEINGSDLAILLNFWGAPNPPTGDLTGDGTIDGADISVLLNNWGS
ncbi:MAG: dockerin type I domain-containing protein, partial [Phycisphaerales bacterium]